MTREEMLSMLAKTPFAYIDPLSEWQDVGFSERPIWVNSKGYGYLSCDEPAGYWEGAGLDAETWAKLKKKLEHKSIMATDIKGTVLEDMLDSMHSDMYDFEDVESLFNDLQGLLSVDLPSDYLAALETWDGIEYFTSEEEFRVCFERDWVDDSWDEMDDKLLAVWIIRLRNEKLL